jgi:hypothetical protein
MKVKNTIDRMVHFDFQIENQLVEIQVFLRAVFLSNYKHCMSTTIGRYHSHCPKISLNYGAHFASRNSTSVKYAPPFGSFEFQNCVMSSVFPVGRSTVK